MIEQYLTGLSYDNCADWDKNLQGLYVINGRNSYHYLATYSVLQSRKTVFFDILQNYQKETKKDWEIHHIIERQHLKLLYAEAEVSYLYNSVWPCILIHHGEHYAYNSILHSKEPKELFLSDKSNKQELLQKIKKMYSDVYLGNSILSAVAQNVLSNIKT